MPDPIKEAVTFLSSLKPYRKHVNQISLCSICRWGNQDLEILTDLSNIAKLLNWRVRIQISPWNSMSVFLLFHLFSKYLLRESISGLNIRKTSKLSELSDKIQPSWYCHEDQMSKGSNMFWKNKIKMLYTCELLVGI